jgi:hypothetical protein
MHGLRDIGTRHAMNSATANVVTASATKMFASR